MRSLVYPFLKAWTAIACATHILANVDALSERWEVAIVVSALALAGMLIVEFVEAVQSALWLRARRIRRDTDAR